MRDKQAENEAAEMARERESRENEAAEGDKYSIRRCVSVINTMELTIGEKAKAIAVIAKSKDSREAFLCTFEVDQECALIWLKNEMAKQVRRRLHLLIPYEIPYALVNALFLSIKFHMKELSFTAIFSTIVNFLHYVH
jgi:hypothetical protein